MKERLTAWLKESGACAAGLARIHPVDNDEWSRYENWLREGKHAEMTYMERNLDVRKNPGLLLEGSKTLISIAFNYRQTNPLQGEVATYALGEDYHESLRKRLQEVVSKMQREFGGEYRICIDSAPLLERYWALEAGIGERSPLHGNITVAGVGSMVFLAEIITTIEFDKSLYGKPLFLPENTKATDASAFREYPCPTGALGPDGTIDSGRCINYLTIEHRGEWTAEQRELMCRPGSRNVIFGCDLCLLADRLNSPPAADCIPELAYNENLGEYLSRLKDEAESGCPAKPTPGFSLRRSPLGRAGRKALIRNFKKG